MKNIRVSNRQIDWRLMAEDLELYYYMWLLQIPRLAKNLFMALIIMRLVYCMSAYNYEIYVHFYPSYSNPFS